jgi:rubrerythrin
MQDTTSHDVWIARVCDNLNKLVQLDFDAACTYREALLHVDDATVRADLHAFLGDHERHVMELSRIVRDLGGVPIEAHRDFKGALLEGMTRLRSRGTLGALRAMRMNEKLTNRSYDKAADVYMPPIGQIIVIENLADERRHLAAIEAHIDRLGGKRRASDSTGRAHAPH